MVAMHALKSSREPPSLSIASCTRTAASGVVATLPPWSSPDARAVPEAQYLQARGDPLTFSVPSVISVAKNSSQSFATENPGITDGLW
jgi:hypothetical protein